MEIFDRSIKIDQSYKKSSNQRYKLNDLDSVFTHYDKNLGINVPTENKLKEDINNDNENSK